MGVCISLLWVTVLGWELCHVQNYSLEMGDGAARLVLLPRQHGALAE